jgi:hypothetical protein
MPYVLLPLNTQPYGNADNSAIPDSLSAELYDGYTGELNCTEKRPGLESWVDTGTGLPIDGLHWWDEQNQLIAVSGGSCFRVTDDAGTFTDITGSAPFRAVYTAVGSAGLRVKFAPADSYLVAANTGKMVLIPSSGNQSYVSDVDAPEQVTGVGYLDGYTLASKMNTGQFYFSDIRDPATWNAADVFTAETKPDVLMTMDNAFGEIFCLGQRTGEFWYNDGTTPFRRIDGAGLEMGTRSPYTLCFANNSWWFLNENRQLVYVAGRNPKVMSSPFQKEFDAMEDVVYATLDKIDAFGQHWLILSFPVDGKTYCYDYAKNEWQGKWSEWSAGHRLRFKGAIAAWCPDWGFWVVGDKANGKLYKVSRSTYQDDGTIIRTTRVTGQISHGTHQRKECKGLTIRAKRGVGSGTRICVRWNDDGKGWGSEHWADMGTIGDGYMFCRFRRCGMYRVRQYEISHSDNTDFVLVGGEEEVEILS